MMGLCVDIVEVCGYLWIFMKVSLISQQICILWKMLYLFSVCSCCRRLISRFRVNVPVRMSKVRSNSVAIFGVVI